MTAPEIYSAAIKKFGAEAQTRKAVEELTELSLALQHAPSGKSSHYNICEEIADVRIMLDQLELIYNRESAIECWTVAKLKRLEILVTP